MTESKQALCSSLTGEGCALKKILDVIGGKWKILILCLIDSSEVCRFNEMKREIAGITNTMLSSSLKEMEADGLILRKQYNEIPVRVEYSLTEKAHSLIPILLELKAWGEENL
jgi:DNA-binding HxlR family transcriptional regulator